MIIVWLGIGMVFRRIHYWILFFIILLFSVYFIRHYRAIKPVNSKTIAVVLAKVENKNLPVYLSALGNVTATSTVTVKTQINGLLMKVLFQEGQWVKTGDVLAEIDQRLLLAQLTQYQGQLTRDKALLANAQIDLKRYQNLWKQDSISQQTLATQQSLVRQYQGTVEIDEGLIASTKVNLSYCRITSPIDGRVGLRLVDPGNFVQTADTTGIAVITSLDPITVIFTLPEDDLHTLLPQALIPYKMKVKAYDRQQNKLLSEGTLITMDNQIDNTTGTVKLRAQFDNKNQVFFPNQFVNIKLLANTLIDAKVVPTAAVQHGSKEDFVFILNADLTVRAKSVITGVTQGNETVITKGLLSGQEVVIDGADKLTDGAKVTIKNRSNPTVKN